jgi:hypothetical protein
VPGKVPPASGVTLGEILLNTADAVLYTSGTTANDILPIGWDRVHRTGDTMTGTLYLPSLSGTSLSAETLNINNYIDFNTGTTSPSLVSGRVFYNNNSHSLSYYPDGNKNVIVNMGQQQYIRVHNNSGSLIPKGSAVKIQTSTNGLPNVTLSISTNDTNNQVVGLVADNISNNTDGFVLSHGILSGLTINTFNIGDIIYLSDTIPGGYVASTSSLSYSARTNQIGYIIATGTTTGEIFVSISNENINLTITDIERNILEGNVISTGTYDFTGITTASTTTINIAPIRGWIVKNTYSYSTLPDVVNLYYTGGTNISLPNIGTSDSTYILLNSGSTIVQQTTFPTPQERRENIYLGKVVHPNRITITSVNNTVDFDVSPMSALRDLWTPLKLINQGILVSANGANLNINTSSGTLWGNGIGWITNQLNPDSVAISGQSPSTFQYRVQTGGTFSNTTTIDVSHYDLNGVVTLVGGGSNASTNQRVYMFPTGLVRVQYGQKVYNTLSDAVAGVQTESFVEYPNNRDNGILIGVISVNKNATLLNNTSQTIFTLVSKFGEILGGTGGLSTTTLQQAYDNSSTPEIVINATLDGLSIKNGTGNADNVTRLFEGLNSSGNATSFIRADGDISGTTVQTNGFIGNNTGVTASTLNIQTLGGGTSINNLGIDSNGNVVVGTTGGSTFTGGTVSGATNFTNGLTANTISATTYYNLPIDVYTTGGTYNGANILFTNNTGGTFTVTGLTASGFSANYYGSFSDTTNQPVSGASTPTVWTYNTTELSNGISVVNGSRIKVNNKGVYEIGYSAQLEKTQGTDANVTIWASINGSPVIRSSSTTSLVANSSLQLPFVSYIFELEANDYVEFYFSSSNQYVQLTSLSGLTSPTRPVSPSVIIVAKQVGLSVTDNLGGYYLPLSGGTVTGGTQYTSGLTANTLSATTYYNLPTDIRVTGGTYSNGSLTFTNNTGGTFNILTSTNYSAGVISGATYSSTGTGQVNLPAVKVALYNNANNIEPIVVYDVASGTTGSGGISGLTDNDTNYIVIDYNGGSPIYKVLDNDGTVNNSSIVLFMIIYRLGNFVHTLEFGNYGAGLPEKLNNRILQTDRFARESGLSLGLSGSTGIVTLTSGVAWNGSYRQSLVAVNSQDDIFFKNYHSGGTWTYNTTGDTLNNTYYDNGTNIVVATSGKYLVNWYFRGQEINDHLYEVYGTNEYASVSEAQLSTEPLLPELITSHAFLTGRIIVQVGATTGSVESSFVSVFQSTQVTSHNDLNAIQGGTAGEYYHLTSNQYNNNAYVNVNNNFTTNQTITGNLNVTGGTQSIFSGNSSSDLVRITQTGSGNALVIEDSSNPDSTPFVVDNSGNVGIGTTTPSTKLDVKGIGVFGSSISIPGVTLGDYTDTFTGKYSILSTNNHADFIFGSNLGIDTNHQLYVINTHPTIAGSAIVLGGNNSTNGTNTISFFARSQASVTANTIVSAVTADMVIKEGGKVGVGTTNPTVKFDVQITGGTGNQLAGRFLAGTNSNGNAGGITVGTTQTQCGYIYGEQTSVSTGDLVFGVQNLGSYAERVRILGNGNVGIGTTLPSEKLHVSGNTIVSGTISGGTMVITTSPTNNDSPTQLITRNSSTGQLESTSPQSSGLFNYGLANAMMTGNFLT